MYTVFHKKTTPRIIMDARSA